LIVGRIAGFLARPCYRGGVGSGIVAISRWQSSVPLYGAWLFGVLGISVVVGLVGSKFIVALHPARASSIFLLRSSCASSPHTAAPDIYKAGAAFTRPQTFLLTTSSGVLTLPLLVYYFGNYLPEKLRQG